MIIWGVLILGYIEGPWVTFKGSSEIEKWKLAKNEHTSRDPHYSETNQW